MIIKKVISGFSISVLIMISSCATPSQKIIDAPKVNEVPAELNKIIASTGQLSDEDINITVYKSVISSVVGINTTSVARDFFSFRPVQGTGSGVLISKNGYILTNYHVVSNANKLEVTLADKSSWIAKTIGGSKEKDVAVIKIDAPSSKYTIASLGDSNGITIGQKVLAIGSPYGLSGTLTTGIISSLNRTLPAEDGTVLKDIIQTDAAINPGNSGGPLLNSKGEIIGINTAIFSPNGGSVGIGFAVPINNVKDVLNEIQAKL
jgi:S1-C subfamily serine protease